MASMMAPTLPFMPGRSHPSAPKFTGVPAHLDMFFDELEMLSQACNLTVATMIKWTVLYAPTEDYELWKYAEQQQINEDNNWEIFKAHIYGFYPGSDDDRRYRLADLETLSMQQRCKAMNTLDDFGAYYREFFKVWYFLKCRNRVTDREASSLFISGFNLPFKAKLREQLKLQNPRHYDDDPFGLPELYEAAIFVLSCRLPDIETAKANHTSVKLTVHGDVQGQSISKLNRQGQQQSIHGNDTRLTVAQHFGEQCSKQTPLGARYSSVVAQITETPNLCSSNDSNVCPNESIATQHLGDRCFQQESEEAVAFMEKEPSEVGINSKIISKHVKETNNEKLSPNSKMQHIVSSQTEPVPEKRYTFLHSWLKDDYTSPSSQEQADPEKVYVLACAISQNYQGLHSIHSPNTTTPTHVNINSDKQGEIFTLNINDTTSYTREPPQPAKCTHTVKPVTSHNPCLLDYSTLMSMSATCDAPALHVSKRGLYDESAEQMQQGDNDTHIWQKTGTRDTISLGRSSTHKSRDKHDHDTDSCNITRQSSTHTQYSGHQWTRGYQGEKLSKSWRIRYPRNKCGSYRVAGIRGPCTSLHQNYLHQDYTRLGRTHRPIATKGHPREKSEAKKS